jgi:prepilin-type N-terminal cleavage/methylation domain-containing protein
MSTQNSKKGFTLIELMVVIVIIGILAAIAIPKLFGMTAKAKASEVGPASGTWSKLQQAFSLEIPKAGDFVAIGYTPPGILDSTKLIGTTTNFKYEDKGTYGDDHTAPSNKAKWQASNVQKLNDCAVTATNIWMAEYDATQAKVTDIEVAGQKLLSGDSVKTASGVCGSLTPTFGYLK